MPSDYSSDEDSSELAFFEFNKCPKQAQGESCNACDAISAIDKDICQAENSLSLLKYRRLLLLRNMNDVHDPLVSRLPLEVVARIFFFFLPANVDVRYSIICPEDVPLWETPTTPLVLGAVCRTWRSVVWSTPKLWTSISINIYHSRGRLVDMVGEWLGRSGSLPLYIHLYAWPECQAHREYSWVEHCSSPPRGSEPYIAKLTDIINAYSERWFYLDLSLPRPYMEQVQFMNGRVGMLNTLNLEAIVRCTAKAPINDREFGDALEVNKISNLQNLCVRGFSFHQLDINWENLTCVEAAKIPAGTGLRLLQAAPFLTHCTFWDVVFCPDIHDMHDPIRHNSLNFLYVKGYQAEEIIRLTTLPALEHLATNIYRLDEFGHFQDFLERSACSLKGVGLEVKMSPGYKTQQIISLIREIVPLSVETLVLDCKYLEYFEYWDASVNREIQEAMMNDNSFLPNLKTLHIVIRALLWNCALTLSCSTDGLSPIFSSPLKHERYFHIFTLFNCAPNMTYLPDLEIQKNIPSFIERNFGDSLLQKQELSSSFIRFVRWAPSQYQSLLPLIMRLREVWDLGIWLTDTSCN